MGYLKKKMLEVSINENLMYILDLIKKFDLVSFLQLLEYLYFLKKYRNTKNFFYFFYIIYSFDVSKIEVFIIKNNYLKK